ncbi:MAG TPA: hypothetical protein VGN95_02420 [Pyrinomonadaceae bacterium]|jgi:hypothetical protein|nr:hypothetical protein [Pyrinomonadaceae bacterium]
MDKFFVRKPGNPFPRQLVELAADSLAMVQCWEPYHLPGPERGREFEKIFCRYCEVKGLTLSERPGSRTLCGQKSASGFHHESDAVIAMPSFMVHVELKYLTEELDKNQLLIFNQKGLDFLAASGDSLRRRPLYRLLVSGRLISQEARKFALQWGIITVEPDRMPLPVIHKLAGSCIPGQEEWAAAMQEEIWAEIPRIISPLQQRVERLASIISEGEPLLSEPRIDRVLSVYQLQFGDACWNAMDEVEPGWIEERYDALKLEEMRMGISGC